jgi:high affinity Mn2+ porin
MRAVKFGFFCTVVIGGLCWATGAAAQMVGPPSQLEAPPVTSNQSYDWTGPYFGGNVGMAWGSSSWTAGPGISGSSALFQPIDHFNEGGSWFAGVQGGYNYVLPNRLLLGAELDFTAPSSPKLPTGVNPFGISIGHNTTFESPALDTVSFAETVLASGTARARLGYAPGDWLFYGTGGLAWTYDRQSLTQVSTGNTVTPSLWRLGWTVGAGVETPIAPHWTLGLQYLYTDYGKTTTGFFGNTQPVTSDWKLQELRLGLNYQFGAGAAPSATEGSAEAEPDNLAFHGQFTFVGQGYPAIRSPYVGANSLPGGGQIRETTDATLAVGYQPWQGGQFWFEPEIDQGFGLANTHGLAGFATAEAFKLGASYPYARVDRYFLRQTFELGGPTQNIDADMGVFAGTTTQDRVVLTAGKYSIVDIFDTNKYANDPKTDFLNWSAVNAGSFDYAGDAWGMTYGVAAEWYTGDWTLRSGIFDMSKTPAESANSAQSYGLDGSFQQFQLVDEIEHRHRLWDQPGALRLTAFLTRGRMANFGNAIELSQTTGLDINDATAADRRYRNRPGVSLNMEQQVTDTVGVFARAGWADGNVEPWDFTDIDRTVQTGVSITGKDWGRPDDTVGAVGIINGISKTHEAWFNDGGLGILIGDGMLPKYGLEKIFETYYSYAITSALKLSADYQFAADPGYNRQRGPVSIGAVRLHWEF